MDFKYWCDKSILISVDGPDGYFCTAVEKPFARIGSHSSSEIVLGDESVASRGLYLHATDEGIFCVDLSPPDEGGHPLRGSLTEGQILSLGPYRISAKIVGQSTDSSELPDLEAKGSSQSPQPTVTISVRGQEIARRLLQRQLTVVGRVKPSTMRIKSPYVSASHCVLYWHDEVLWAVDLLSGNNTLLDGKQIDVTRIPIGHPLRLGNVLLNYLPISAGPVSAGPVSEDPVSEEQLAESIHDLPLEIPAESPTVFRAEICPGDAPENTASVPLDPVGVDNAMVPVAGEPFPATNRESPNTGSAAGDSNLWLGASGQSMNVRAPQDVSAEQDDEFEAADETDDQASIFNSDEAKTSPSAPTVVEHRSSEVETPADTNAIDVEMEITEGDMVSTAETVEVTTTESDADDTPEVAGDTVAGDTVAGDISVEHESETSLADAGSTVDDLMVVSVSDAITPQNYDQYLDLADGDEGDTESMSPPERDDADDDHYFITDRLIEMGRGNSRKRYLVRAMIVVCLTAVVSGVLFFAPQLLEFLR